MIYFLKNILSSAIGFFLALGLIFLLFMGVLGALFFGKISEQKKPKMEIKDNSVLKIQLRGTLKDYVSEYENLFSKVAGQNDFWELRKVCNAIKTAAYDNKIKGISLELQNLEAGISQLKELREYLSFFKKQGKWIKAYSDTYAQKTYYLSSVADSIFVHPMGQVDFKGLSMELLFFKDLLNKYGIEMQTIRQGKYKSAIEPFIASKISPSNQKQMTALLEDIWKNMKKDIAKDRKVSLKKLDTWADNSLGRNAQMALKNGLVDGILYKDVYTEQLKQKLSTKNLSIIYLEDYHLDSKKYRDTQNKIALVYAQGSIMYSEENPNTIVPSKLFKTFEKIKEDSLIKAVVLRINSPGGSALASDLICRGIEKLKQKKPVIVSMGNVAASGGYYIASAADYIFAEPMTITGSIGVFGIVPNIRKLSKNMGIHAHRIATNKGAYYSIFQNPKKDFISIAQQNVDSIYKRFISKVAKGRSMKISQVENLAQGRVWSGTAAFENKLVDSLGGLQNAIEKAAMLAAIQKYKILKFPRYKDGFKEIFKKITRFNSDLKLKKALLKQFFGNTYTQYIQDFIKAPKKPFTKNIQARLPFFVQIN